nr:SLC13 family permease [Ignatzschineria cameli]
MINSTVVLFLLVYLAMALGKLPGFKLDRTGSALVGALGLMVIGDITGQEAWDAINYKTIALLFGLMVLSGAFGVSGFYSYATYKVASLNVSSPLLLAILIGVSGGLSSLLTNDVVVVAMTPLLISLTMARNLNPIPFVLGFCFAANTGSAGTLIGSPQNMIIAQSLDLSFTELLKIAGIPALLSMVLVWGVTSFIYRGRWQLSDTKNIDKLSSNKQLRKDNIAINHVELLKATLVAIVVMIAFVWDLWPQSLVALAAAGVLLLNKKIASDDVLKEVNYNLLILIASLFVVNKAMAMTGLPQLFLAELKTWGLDLNDPLSLLFTGAILSNSVGNNPAVMLLTPYLHSGSNAASLGAALTLGTGFASNLMIFGSLAGIIAVEESKKHGVIITFGEFLKSGFLVAGSCLAMAAGWIYWFY